MLEDAATEPSPLQGGATASSLVLHVRVVGINGFRLFPDPHKEEVVGILGRLQRFNIGD